MAEPQAGEWTIIDTFDDKGGQPVCVGVKGGTVAIGILPGEAALFDHAERDRFAKAWAEAERRAEDHQAVSNG